MLLQSNSACSVKTISKTGLAVTQSADGSGTAWAYYQDAAGNIYEQKYNCGQSDSGGAEISSDQVASGAAQHTPIAATSYQWNGDTWRQVFYTDASGSVQTVRRSSGGESSSSGAWSSPMQASAGPIQSNTPALAACIFQDNIHVYLGSAKGGIREAVGGTNGGSFDDGEFFREGDAKSGVACSVQPNKITVYFRASQGRVQQHALLAGENVYQYDASSRSW